MSRNLRTVGAKQGLEPDHPLRGKGAGDAAAVEAAPGTALDARATRLGRPVGPQYRRIYLAMATSDITSVVTGIVLADLLLSGPDGPGDLLFLSLSCLPLVGLVFSGLHLYGAHLLSSAEEFRRLILGVSVVMVALVASPWWPASALSRLWIALTWFMSVSLVLATRRLWHRRIRRLRARGRMIARTIIVGTNGEAVELPKGSISRGFGFQPVGYVATGTTSPQVTDGLPVLGDLDQLRELIARFSADCIYVASSAVNVDEMRFISKVASRAGADLRITANLPMVLSTRLTVQPIGGVMALALRPVRLSGGQALAKRTFDIVLSFTALLVLLPLFLLTVAVIKATSPGPIFYRQQRVGRHGRPFTLLKFRTMMVGAEALLHTLRDKNEADGPLFKIRNDPRITDVGRWLRRWSLDELPQLLNVLKGDMSLVGPRPPLPHEVKEYEDWHFERLEVRPGLTGLWQVSGRSDLPFDDGVRLDLFYVENWSLAYDMFILLKTFPAIFTSRGAY
jgi:exopolysaccharide biosynthesis polyprenyl glycosylphosphotransferase